MEVWKTEDQRVNFEKRFAHYEVVCCGCDTSYYSIGPHPVSSFHIYTFVVSRVFMADAASQAGDADSSRSPGLTSDLRGSVNVHRGAVLLVPQWQFISSFVFYSMRNKQVEFNSYIKFGQLYISYQSALYIHPTKMQILFTTTSLFSYIHVHVY